MCVWRAGAFFYIKTYVSGKHVLPTKTNIIMTFSYFIQLVNIFFYSFPAKNVCLARRLGFVFRSIELLISLGVASWAPWGCSGVLLLVFRVASGVLCVPYIVLIIYIYHKYIYAKENENPYSNSCAFRIEKRRSKRPSRLHFIFTSVFTYMYIIKYLKKM